MRELFLAVTLLGLWGFSSTALAGDQAKDWQRNGTQYRYNPYTQSYQATPQGERRELKNNPFNGQWSYEKPEATPKYNPFDGKWEYAK